jgi:VanZ family protein
VHRGRFLLAWAAAAAVILSAPFVGQIRSAIRAQFPGRFVLVVGSIIGTVIGAALLATLLRIRERRALRYGALACAALIGVGYSIAFAQGRPDVDVVERFHFIEFGVVTLLFYRAWRPRGDWSIVVLPYLAGLLVGTLEEWFQWFIPVRVGEMRDIFLNSVAIATGLLFSVALDPPPTLAPRLRPDSLRVMGRVAAVVILAIAAFFHIVHLGHEIQDPEAGSFRSRYTAGQLADLSAARARQWQAVPPPLAIPRVSREDQYLTEGIEHVRRRNELWDGGDGAAAWHENRILEKYFAPVIDVRSYHAKDGSRWPDEQRRNAELAKAGGGTDVPPYVSRSNPAPIYTWSKGLFWLVTFAAIAALAGVTGLTRLSAPQTASHPSAR